jgi:hypothetical protein
MMYSALVILMLITQTPAVEVAVDPTQPWWLHALQAVATLLGGLFVWLLKSYGGKLVALIIEKSGNPFLGEITQRALIVALSFYQTEVRNMKKTAQWNDIAKEKLRQRAITHLKMLLDEEKLIAAAGGMGLHEFLGHHVEAAVATAKQLGAAKKKPEESQPDPIVE